MASGYSGRRRVFNILNGEFRKECGGDATVSAMSQMAHLYPAGGPVLRCTFAKARGLEDRRGSLSIDVTSRRGRRRSRRIRWTRSRPQVPSARAGRGLPTGRIVQKSVWDLAVRALASFLGGAVRSQKPKSRGGSECLPFQLVVGT